MFAKITSSAQARQLRNGPPFLITEQVGVQVDGHLDAGMAHELVYGSDINVGQKTVNREVPCAHIPD